MAEFAGLRSKMYSFITEKKKKKKAIKRCNKILKNIAKNKITFDDYCSVLNSKISQNRMMNIIRSYKHTIYSKTLNKITLSADDDKRIICKDGKSTYVYG